jgi:hypothetical protein
MTKKKEVKPVIADAKEETVKKETSEVSPQAFPPPISPYDKCMADHIGQSGKCSADGTWTPIS